MLRLKHLRISPGLECIHQLLLLEEFCLASLQLCLEVAGVGVILFVTCSEYFIAPLFSHLVVLLVLMYLFVQTLHCALQDLLHATTSD